MSFAAVDLSKLPAPDIVEALDYETILAARKARMKQLLAEAGILADWNAELESDTLVKLLEEGSYREMLLRQRVNDGCRAVMLARTSGTDLDNLAANFSTERLEIAPAQPEAVPPVAAVMEGDDSLKARTQLAFEALSTAGPEGAYIYHAKSADSRVADVKITSPTPGQVVVTVLSAEGDGTAGAGLLAAVAAAMPGTGTDGVRPFTDHVVVQAGTRIDYAVAASLELYDGPDTEVVRAAALDSISAFTAAHRLLGEPVTIDGLHKALRVEGVRRVTLTEPAGSVEVGETAFANCTGIAVSIATDGEA